MNGNEDSGAREARTEGPDAATQDALAWFARLQSEDLSAEERRAFEAWQARDRSHAEAFQRVVALWEAEDFATALQRHDPQPSKASESRPRHSPRVFRRVAAMAATLILVFGLSQWSFLLSLTADVRTGVGERLRVELEDGSVMTLNTASAATMEFSRDRRRVRLLSGEAYFEVARDPRRGFEVESGDAVARVLATGFALRNSGSSVTVMVRHGRVEVAAVGATGEVRRLGPDEQVLLTDGRLGRKATRNVALPLSWLEGRFTFEKRPLGDVLAELGRHHAGWIVVADDDLRATEVSGSYRLDDPTAIVASLAEATSAELIRVSDYLLILR